MGRWHAVAVMGAAIAGGCIGGGCGNTAGMGPVCCGGGTKGSSCGGKDCGVGGGPCDAGVAGAAVSSTGVRPVTGAGRVGGAGHDGHGAATTASVVCTGGRGGGAGALGGVGFGEEGPETALSSPHGCCWGATAGLVPRGLCRAGAITGRAGGAWGAPWDRVAHSCWAWAKSDQNVVWPTGCTAVVDVPWTSLGAASGVLSSVAVAGVMAVAICTHRSVVSAAADSIDDAPPWSAARASSQDTVSPRRPLRCSMYSSGLR